MLAFHVPIQTWNTRGNNRKVSNKGEKRERRHSFHTDENEIDNSEEDEDDCCINYTFYVMGGVVILLITFISLALYLSFNMSEHGYVKHNRVNRRRQPKYPSIESVQQIKQCQSLNKSTSTIIIMIVSTSGKTSMRMAIRNSWRRTLTPTQQQAIFIVGRTTRLHITKQLQIEEFNHGDVIYNEQIWDHQQTLKHIASIRIYHDQCVNAKYLMIINDHTTVNIHKLQSTILSYFGEVPVNQPVLASFKSGYILNYPAAQKLLQEVGFQHIFPINDAAYVPHTLTKLAGILSMAKNESNTITNCNQLTNRLVVDAMDNEQHLTNLWNKLQQCISQSTDTTADDDDSNE